MRVPRRFLSLIWQTSALAALLLILLAGCAPAWPFPQPTPDPKLPDAQQIFHPLEIGPNAADLWAIDPPLIQFGSDQNVAQLIFPQIMTLDEQEKPIDWAAERHEISDDGLTYTFHLRKGMTWSDGSPIDANTFAYSINRTLDPCTATDVAWILYVIKGAQAFNEGTCPADSVTSATTLIGSSLLVPDPLTLRIRLERPAGYFLAVLTAPAAWAVPRALVERYTTLAKDAGIPRITSTWTDHLADNGGFGGNLYRLTRWDHAGHLKLERNERFWGQKLLLRRIEYTLYKDASVAWSEFQTTGAGDVGYPAVANSSDPRGAIGYEIAAARALKGVTVQQTPLLAVSNLRLNWRLAPFDDPHVRQAFSLAIDRETIAHEIYHDSAQPSIHLIPGGMPGYNSDLADAARRTGKNALTADLDTARKLASAYAAEKCHGNVATCPSVMAPLPRSTGSVYKVDVMIVAQWQAAFPGWPIAVAYYNAAQHLEPVHQLDNSGWSADYADPKNFVSDLWTTQAYYNRGFESVPQVDALCAQADGMSDLSARIPLYQQAEQLLVTQGAAIPYAQPLITYAVRAHVVGWSIAPMGQTPLSVWQTAYIKR